MGSAASRTAKGGKLVAKGVKETVPRSNVNAAAPITESISKEKHNGGESRDMFGFTREQGELESIEHSVLQPHRHPTQALRSCEPAV